MSLCKLADEYIVNGYTMLDNKFITDFLHEADDVQLKVYIFGLYQATSPILPDNSVAHFCNALNISEEQIVSAYEYWRSLGLVNIISYDPLEVRYNYVKNLGEANKLYKPAKYADFNSQLQDIFPDREISQGEYVKYYEFLEQSKLPQEVLLMIARYCVNFKGYGIRQNYVLAVAKNWYDDGIRTVSDAEQCIARQEASNEAMRLIFKALGKKSAIEIEDKQLYIKWTQSWGFDLQSILYACKLCKNKGGIPRLDKTLDEFFVNNCLSVADMQSYNENKQILFDLAKDVTKTIGVRYEQLDTVVSHYINPWLAQGFDKDSVLLIAEYCFQNSIRSLAGMNVAVSKFYKNGCVTCDSINAYLDALVTQDKLIKAVIDATMTNRIVTQSDRETYAMWLDWGFEQELILYCASLSQGKPHAFGYITKLLSKCKENRVFDVENAKKLLKNTSQTTNTAPAQNERRYTKEELNSFFDNIQNYDDIEV